MRRPSADAVAGNGRPLSWAPSADAVAGGGDKLGGGERPGHHNERGRLCGRARCGAKGVRSTLWARPPASKETRTIALGLEGKT